MIQLVSKHKTKLWFLFIFILLVVWYRADAVISDPFRSSHNWRKTDGLSFSLNYYEHGMQFFKPEMHGLISEEETSGYTTGEFPLLYYTNALLWKVFGRDEVVNGLFGLLLLFMAMYFMCKAYLMFLESKKLVLLFMLLFTSSPLLWIYAALPLTNMPAVLLAIIGWYFFFKYCSQQKTKQFILCISLFSLATLLKASEFISLAAVGILYVFELLTSSKEKKIFSQKIMPALVMGAGILLPLLWYLYAIAYNDHFGGHLTSNSIAPIWEVESGKMGSYWSSLRDHILPTFYHRSMMYLLLLVVFYNLFSYQKAWRFLYVLKTTILVLSIAYFFLWFKALDVNHYYFITFFTLVFIEFLYFMLMLKSKWGGVLKNKGFISVTCVFILLNMAYGKTIVEMSYVTARGVHILSPNSDYEGIMKYYDGEYNNKTKYLMEMEEYLDSMNISKSAKVISLPDPTFNMSLYMMNRKGWTYYLYKSEAETLGEFVEDKIRKGASLLVITEDELLQDSTIKPYLTQPIGENGPVKIYQLNTQ